MARNLYTPERHGFVQDSYVDQMASATIGQIGYTSDYNLCDTFIAHPSVDPDGLVVGVGVVEKSATDAPRPGFNESLAAYPEAAANADDFAGILVRHNQMSTNSAGQPCVFGNDLCNVIRKTRVGGRIWLMLSNGTTAKGQTAHWIVSDTSGHGLKIGSFSATAIPGDSVELPFVEFLGAFTAPATGTAPAFVEVTPA